MPGSLVRLFAIIALSLETGGQTHERHGTRRHATLATSLWQYFTVSLGFIHVMISIIGH